jgi:hypothetical protein
LKRALALAATLAPAVAILLGCAGRTPPADTVGEGTSDVGVYRGQAWDESGRRVRFRLLLHARPPDRVHAELIRPVGGTAWVFDAGDGQVSLTIVEEATAYVGAARADVVRRLLGVAVAPAAFVHAILDGEPPGDGIDVVRLPHGRPGLPQSFELREGTRGFRLERSEIRRVGGPGLGTGRPPAGVRQLPIEDLDAPSGEN